MKLAGTLILLAQIFFWMPEKSCETPTFSGPVSQVLLDCVQGTVDGIFSKSSGKGKMTKMNISSHLSVLIQYVFDFVEN